MTKKKLTEAALADDIRAAITNSGITAAEIARATGIAQSTVSRFLLGKNLGVDIAGKLVAYFGMRLEPRAVLPQKPRQVELVRGRKYPSTRSKAASKSKRSR